MLEQYLPTVVNRGPWITAYTLNELAIREAPDWVLPVCSLATPYEELERLGDGLLPPLFREALDGPLREQVVARIRQCFPRYRHASPPHKPPNEPGEAGSGLRVVDFENPELLVKEGRNLFRAGPELEPVELSEPELAERSLERSNVVPVRELAQLIALQRAFDVSMQTLHSQDQATAGLVREIRS